LQDTTDDFVRHAITHLVRAGGLFERHDHAGHQVSGSEVMALGELAHSEALSQQALADRLGLEKSTVSRLTASLEQRGWLVRERDPANRRYHRLRLTLAGFAAHMEIGADLRRRHDAMLDALTPEEREGLLLGLRGLLRVLGAHHR
jgi:DNA-binding MarR family transcriptional regulator